MFQQEYIYNIVPAKKNLPECPSHYISNYPPDISHRASTFILPGSWFPGISNYIGEFKLPRGCYSSLKKLSTFGQQIGYYAPDPSRKGINHRKLPSLEKLHINCRIKSHLYQQLMNGL